MVGQADRAFTAEQCEFPADDICAAITNRFAASLRDEAIWQYHLRGERGVIVWGRDHSFRYLHEIEDWLCGPALAHMVAEYNPTQQALVLSEGPERSEVLLIDDAGSLTRVRSPHFALRNETDS